MQDVSSTAKLILDVYQECRICPDEYLSMKALILTKIKWHGRHQENFITALEELTEKGFLTRATIGMTLTKAGYDYLHAKSGNAGKDPTASL